ncbi:PTS sugar transporter subunit IIB [Mycoplasma sp. NEAQ87857]|uniref:PTS sugar transporter subunit IIB n=1 Tax=Mycoplasma sp. NEAQ87857 TaxID=2683967 RepID=UPI001318A149|nr:PTS sugar transporter subunit IIB [Mycoplasma sp. NEAQ87857]QGZ97521.1 PTS sugar transporter subunit IIB [Mycoplasma sp. NEAQ87857]
MKILLICSGGMSTFMLIQALEKEAKKLNINNFSADAIGANEIDEYDKDFDILLVAPQIKHKFEQMQEIASSRNKKIYQISMAEYSPLGTNKLLTNIAKVLEE